MKYTLGWSAIRRRDLNEKRQQEIIETILVIVTFIGLIAFTGLQTPV